MGPSMLPSTRQTGATVPRGKGDKGDKGKAARQDKARDDKAKAQAKRDEERARGEEADKAIRDDPNRRHPW